ncbi:MAG: hypothetical protein JWQ70_1454 [Aeromicrobium sp.]|nr:hypothetical protein [Aeromicrobium sp.]
MAAGVVLVVIIGFVAFIVVRNTSSSNAKPWDPRIKPYAKIVEDQRNLKFDHPVKVRFLSDKAFEKTARTDEKELDAGDREDIKQTTALFRAFGLISGDVNLLDAFNDASDSTTLAYYSFDDRVITVRGTHLTLASHATLVHELTHALQDQHFGISARMKKLNKAADDGKPTTEADAFQAVVEGDAERVADLYRASLSKKQQKALENAETKSEGKLDDTKGIPDVVLTLTGAPYALGQSLTEAVASADEDVLNDLFTNPPPDDSVLLDPLKATHHIPDSAHVKIPTLAKGEKKFDSGQVGSLVTYLMLAERIPPREALTAADAWNGDAYVGFTRDDVRCARVEYAAHSAKGASQLSSAFDHWTTGASKSAANVARHGNRITFESCDPGKAAKATKDASTTALELVATRGYLADDVLKSGATVPAARCFARRMVNEFTVANLNNPYFGANDPTVTRRVQAMVKACR